MDYLDKLSRFEKITRRIVEGSVDKVLGASPLANEIANEIALSTDQYISKQFLPTRFEIYLDESKHARLFEELPYPEEHYRKFVEQFALETGTKLNGEAEIKILKAPSDSDSGIQVICGSDLDYDEVTQAFTALSDQKAIDSIRDTDAFLIVNGKRHVPIDSAVLGIGRQLDNNLVLDDSTISRKHAQIRWRFGRFVIHDVGSKSGTFVNGKKVSESVLESGDIITLGKISLIYGEDNVRDKSITPANQDRSGATQKLRHDSLP